MGVEWNGDAGYLGISVGRGLKCSDGAGVMTSIEMTLNKFWAWPKRVFANTRIMSFFLQSGFSLRVASAIQAAALLSS